MRLRQGVEMYQEQTRIIEILRNPGEYPIETVKAAISNVLVRPAAARPLFATGSLLAGGARPKFSGPLKIHALHSTIRTNRRLTALVS